MKIAHISIIPTYSSGIFKKIADKARTASENNLNIDFYLLNLDKEYQSDNLFLLKQNFNFPSAFLNKLLFRIFKLTSLEKLIDFDQYDAFVLRYPLVDGVGNNNFISKYGHKLYSEHHTDEISELLSLSLLDKLRWFLEINGSSKFLSKVSGIITVTDELSEIQLKKIKINKPNTTIANGITKDSFKKTGYKLFDGKKLNIVFISSIFFPWQGLEFLLKILENYNGDVKLELNLVGELSFSQKELINGISSVKVIEHGKLNANEIDTLMLEMNIAVSTLALSKKNMTEACPLKSREYIVRGIPFIYAYKDTDLTGNEVFARQFNENDFTVEDIINFAEEVSKNSEVVSEEFDKYVEIISWKNKLNKMVEFIENNQNSV